MHRVPLNVYASSDRISPIRKGTGVANRTVRQAVVDVGKHPRISMADEPVLTSQSHVRKSETGGLDKGEWTK